jgi:bifunctional UDP-N-acetylglucosamine pyrophosphorylase/glucosamine-1-phosphate N-acetyltransferase
VPVTGVHPAHEWETLGVNSKAQLAELERIHQRDLAYGCSRTASPWPIRRASTCAARLTAAGAMSASTSIACSRATVTLADGVSIGPNCVLRDARIEAGAQILAFTHIDGATVGPASRIGPYARLRPGTVLAEETHVGNFVELKNAKFAAHAKANHLAYVGDAVVGKRVNIGAGTITCNYDGANKYQTVIEDDAFIGSDTQLVAPVTVGAGATLGAGTTLTRDAPAGKLTVSRRNRSRSRTGSGQSRNPRGSNSCVASSAPWRNAMWFLS